MRKTGRKGAAAPKLQRFLRDTSTRLPEQASLEGAVRQVVEQHQRQGGATFSLFFRDLSGQDLYAVSLYPERSRRVSRQDFTPALLRNFISGNLDLLADPRCCIGTWEEDGLIYLDVSVVLGDRTEAIALGKEYNQIAIHEAVDGSLIETGGTGEAWLPNGPPPAPESERLPDLGSQWNGG